MPRELSLVPVVRDVALAFIREQHRHAGRPVGYRFAVGIEDQGAKLRGVALGARPSARALDDGRTLEVTRLVTDGVGNGCSMLYGACVRAAKALGYRSAITYTLASESGASLRASGWRVDAELPARKGWDTPSRPRESRGVDGAARLRWRIDLSA